MNEVEKIYEEQDKDASALKAQLDEQHDKDIRDLRAKLGDIETSCDHLKRQKKELYEQFDELEKDLEDEKSRSQTRIDSQTKTIKALEADIETLKNAVTEKERIIHSLQAKAVIRSNTSPPRNNRRVHDKTSGGTKPRVSSSLISVINADTDTSDETEIATKYVTEASLLPIPENNAEPSTLSQTLPSQCPTVPILHDQASPDLVDSAISHMSVPEDIGHIDQSSYYVNEAMSADNLLASPASSEGVLSTPVDEETDLNVAMRSLAVGNADSKSLNDDFMLTDDIGDSIKPCIASTAEQESSSLFHIPGFSYEGSEMDGVLVRNQVNDVAECQMLEDVPPPGTTHQQDQVAACADSDMDDLPDYESDPGMS